MAAGNLSGEEIAVKIVREALEAWAEGDYAKAGTLCGGATRRMLTEAYAHLRPERVISIGEPERLDITPPRYWVPCEYEIERDGEREVVTRKFGVWRVNGRPGRRYVFILHLR